MMPKEQKKYHLSTEHQSYFENVLTFFFLSTQFPKKFWKMTYVYSFPKWRLKAAITFIDIYKVPQQSHHNF